MIIVSNQGCISEFGKRTNNEDNYGLIKGLTYVVCDGVGGAEKGEVASDLTVRCFIEAFKENPYADANIVLKQAEGKISAYVNDNPDAIGMATTLTFSQVREDGIYVAWVGDSRIYHFRNGAIVFKTRDHSWVNEALEAGIIDDEEAINHPKSNIITRAVQGSHKSTVADTALLNDVQKGDLFLHCSDGVLESWDDESLQALFSSEVDPNAILEKINKECAKYSKDNFTAIVYSIENVENSNIQQNCELSPTLIEALPLNHNEFIGTKSKPSFEGVLKVKLMGVPLFLFILIIATPLIIYFFKDKKPQVDVLIKTNGTEKKEISDKIVQSASLVSLNLDSLTKAGWDTIKPQRLKELEDSSRDLRQKIPNEKNISNKEQFKNRLKICSIEIKSLNVDSQRINNKVYYRLRNEIEK